MRWQGGRKSRNVEDQTKRSSGGGNFGSFGSSGGFGKKTTGSSLVIVVIAMLGFLLFGGNLQDLGVILGGQIQPASYETQNVDTNSEKYQEQKEFSAVVFGYLEDYWQEQAAKEVFEHHDPKLVLFSGSVKSACEQASAQVGPFYCPADQKVYVDLSFQKELATKYGAIGDFAMAYVLAHEVGHYIQYELGITEQLERIRRQVSKETYNQYSVRLELMADYLVGSFAKYLKGKTYNGQPILEVGDIEEAITDANAIGDDTLQKEYQGYVVPDSFTHGTSAQRVEWFKRGVIYDDLKNGNTFSGTKVRY